ncbi:DNA-binding protein HU-beta [Pseudoxanthobacter soli DSM 19599]|uniref:DNA-binding protein HU-beta n=1 Tax=Pseudoxanthobacter soli DSM 19599 TaxID=1123029 RepID=A0A1M7ZQB6_9HYPH|nr:HU family DNA-binding protein [Pseudoxanthobacter soli]SHO67108.1 DNA-binding protein HU-beta [Pseudoxanthobacter soli DSM 19599]
MTNGKANRFSKNELTAAVAEKAGLTKADATKAVDAAFDAIVEALVKGDEVRIVGFGTFAVSERAASTGRDPRTGESIDIPAAKVPKFKAGKPLKDAVNA